MQICEGNSFLKATRGSLGGTRSGAAAPLPSALPPDAGAAWGGSNRMAMPCPDGCGHGGGPAGPCCYWETCQGSSSSKTMLVVSHKASTVDSPAQGGLEQRPVMLQQLGASCSWRGRTGTPRG